MEPNTVAVSDVVAFFQAQVQKEKQEKLARFRHLNRYARKGQVVFAGSSLMEQFPIYEFLLDFRLPFTIYNRGVGGFVTDEFYAALEDCVFALEPAHLFLNIGTNDLNGPDYRLEHLLENYEKILQAIRARLPETKLYLMAYYPVNPAAAAEPHMQETLRHRTNARIRVASAGVEHLAAHYDARFLDCNAGLTDAEGNLKAEYTIEGMHMYADGYEPVLDTLLPILREIEVETVEY